VYTHGDVASSPRVTSQIHPGPKHDVEPTLLPSVDPSSCVKNNKRVGVAVARDHNGPKIVGIHAVAVTEVHQLGSIQNHVGAFTTIDVGAGANDAMGDGKRACTNTAALRATCEAPSRGIQTLVEVPAQRFSYKS